MTASAFVEMLQTFGDDNTRIRIVGNDNVTKMALLQLEAPNEVVVKLKSTTEVNAGANLFYQLSRTWSTGAWFKYNHHADQGVDHIVTDLGMKADMSGTTKQVEAMLSNLNDGFDEYIVGLSVANQITDHAQVALYGEYTMDTAHAMSQNGTDFKLEAGVRLNVMF